MAHHSMWGPSGLIVEQIIRRAATLTDEEGAQLFDAWCEQPNLVDTLWGTVVYAAAASGRDAGHISLNVMDMASVAEGATAVRDAAYGAVLCDLAGQHGLTTEHIDALMGPWIEVIGDPRIDPVCLCDTPIATLDLGPLAPQPGDRFPWLVMEVEVGWLEPHIVGYAATPADALNLADKVTGPVVMWRAGKEHS